MARVLADRETGQTAEFGETSWGLVLRAGEGHSDGASGALEELCRKYWYPVYAFARRLGHTPHEAEDYTQELFCRLLQKGAFSRADRRKGKFRSFLIGALKNVLADEHDKARAAKRGGGRRPEFLDPQVEAQYLLEPCTSLSPEALFDRRWGTILLEEALKALWAELTAGYGPDHFEILKPYLTEEASEGDYDVLAVKLGLKRSSVAVIIYRFRQRYYQLVRRAVAQTVTSVDEVEEEIRALFG